MIVRCAGPGDVATAFDFARAHDLEVGVRNYMQADEPIERVRAAFGAESFERLRALKSRSDPHKVLRRNQNIPPR